MAEQVTNYQCPRCTGPLHFNAGTGKLECEYCDSTFSAEEIESLYGEKNENNVKNEKENSGWDLSAVGSEWGAESDGVRVYNCPSCGAELICDDTTAATACPYCDNPTIIPGQLGGISSVCNVVSCFVIQGRGCKS